MFMAAVVVLLFTIANARAQYDAPATYYSSISNQTGTALQTQLRTIVNTGVTGVNYGNARFSAGVTDADPSTGGNIHLMYTRASVPATWDGGSTWNREHIWPDSRLGPGANDPSNTYTGIASDQFNLRPCNPGVNTSHLNRNYGTPTSSGGYGTQSGNYWYPGNTDAGDVARSAFYMATRWSHLSLVNGNPGANISQMGDLNALLHYHYKDVPDTFERRRNHAIYGLAGANSPAIANSFKQSNRNPFVDRPEYAWSVYANQQNDTRLSVAAPDANGGSSASINLGRVLRNAPVPAAQNVTLNKAGVNGTYYSVTAGGSATSTVNGRYNAFAMDTTGSRPIGVGLSTSTATAGLKSGAVVVDNLDVTTQGGAGRGANDANDTINVSLSVLDGSNASFAATDTNSLSIDFGSVELGESVAPIGFSIFNVASSLGASLTAKLDLDSFVEAGDAESVFSTNLATFSNLAAAASLGRSMFFDTSQLGTFDATYTLMFSDENLPGTIGTTQLTLNVAGAVVAVPEPAASALCGMALGMLALRRRRRQ